MQITKRYIYPPRPIHDPVPFDKIDMFRKYGWNVIQTKFNDLRTEISVDGTVVELFNRHKSIHKTFSLSSALRQEVLDVFHLLGLDSSKWSYLDGGLLNGKNKHISGLIVIWDILVRDGEWLIGTTYGERYEWLHQKALVAGGEVFYVTINGQQFEFGIKLSEHIFIPINHPDTSTAWEFTRKVNEVAGWKGIGDGEPVIEGIMIKNQHGVLKPDLGKERNNEEWSARCRVRTGRHRF
jgi:hypothetical protein